MPFGLSNAALPNPVPNGYMDLDWETFRVGSIGPAQRLIPIGERLAVTGFTTDAAIKARAPTRFFRPQSIAVGCYLYTGQGNAALPQKCTITVTATNTRGQKLSPVDFVFEPPLDVGGVSLATTPPLKNNFPSSWTRDDIVRLDFALKEAVTPSVAGVSTAGYVIDEFAFVQHTAAAAREVEISASASTRELADVGYSHSHFFLLQPAHISFPDSKSTLSNIPNSSRASTDCPLEQGIRLFAALSQTVTKASTGLLLVSAPTALVSGSSQMGSGSLLPALLREPR